jgi:heme oxygenase (biliverdin-IX-beta and delta-forming)
MIMQEQADVMDCLKEATRDLHQEAEQHPFQQAMIRGTLSRASYTCYLAQMLGVHGALESALRRHSGLRAIQKVIRPYHFREHLLLEDLATLGGDSLEPPLPLAALFVRTMTDSIRAEPVSSMGFLYVLEGSTNGSKYIAKSVQRALGLSGGRGTCYLNPHGDRQTEHWAAFKKDMSDCEWSDRDLEILVGAAKAMFQGIIKVSDELFNQPYDAAA